MLGLKPVLRQKFSPLHIKNILWLIDKDHVHNLAKYQCSCSKVNIVYRLRKYSTDDKKDLRLSEGTSGEISTTFHTIKETTRTAWYGSIFVVGLGIAGAIFYALFKELFSSNSPNNVYSNAFERCVKDEKVIFNLGEPVKGFGEENRRGRRQHVSHLVYEKDGVNYIRMKFYLKGSRKTGTVHLEMKQNERGNYEYRYLFVQVDGYPYTTIVLEDNRSKTLTPLMPLNKSSDLL